MNYSIEIQEKAKAAVEKGSPMTFEAICAMFQKKEDKQNSSSYKKSAANKMAQRELVRSINIEGSASNWLAEKNRENAMKNIPSSLR